MLIYKDLLSLIDLIVNLGNNLFSVNFTLTN